MRAHSPTFDRTPLIERRAAGISDPVRRLRYLRAKMSEPVPTPAPPEALAPHRHSMWRLPRLGWLALPLALALASGSSSRSAAETAARERGLLVPRGGSNQIASSPDSSAPVSRVWRIEQSESTEVYSNGLRVDLTFTVSNRPRAKFPIFPLTGAAIATKSGSFPVGIVYHTTESQLTEFEEDRSHRLKQLGRNLLEVVRSQRAYHYVIDRFGRVFSVVAESDAANHVGNSVWADAEGIYVNLNDSFLGVAFEAQNGATGDVTPAQIRAAKVLTEMLRSRYAIAAENCVAHAQVSVSPWNMLIGAHTDWAANFPFAALGLPDNYAIPLASVYAYGFEYDGKFLQATQGRWKGLALAAEQVERQAAAEQVPVPRYRSMLQHRYKDLAATLKQHGPPDNPGNDPGDK